MQQSSERIGTIAAAFPRNKFSVPILTARPEFLLLRVSQQEIVPPDHPLNSLKQFGFVLRNFIFL